MSLYHNAMEDLVEELYEEMYQGFDCCHCEQCQSAFREWLRQKYHTLEELNHAWWNRFWSHVYTDWEQCHADIVAYTLNQLPGKYVVTKAGGAISKADSLRFQHITDIRAAMIRAVQVVKDYPRH